MIQLAVLPLGDQILPAKRIERRVMLEVKPVPKMKWLAGEHFQFAIDVIGVCPALRVEADRQRALRDKPILHVASRPSRFHRRITTAADNRLGPLAGCIGKCTLILQPPMRIERELRLVTRLELREATRIALVVQLQNRLIPIEHPLTIAEPPPHGKLRGMHCRHDERLTLRQRRDRHAVERHPRETARPDADSTALERRVDVTVEDFLFPINLHDHRVAERHNRERDRLIELHLARHDPQIAAIRKLHERHALILVRQLHAKARLLS